MAPRIALVPVIHPPARSLSRSVSTGAASIAGVMRWTVVKSFSGIGSGLSFSAHKACTAARVILGECLLFGHAIGRVGVAGAAGMTASALYLLYIKFQRDQLSSPGTIWREPSKRQKDALSQAYDFIGIVDRIAKSADGTSIQSLIIALQKPEGSSDEDDFEPTPDPRLNRHLSDSPLNPNLKLEGASWFGSVGRQLLRLHNALSVLLSAITGLQTAVERAIIMRKVQAEAEISPILSNTRSMLQSLHIAPDASDTVSVSIGRARTLFDSSSDTAGKETSLHQLLEDLNGHLQQKVTPSEEDGTRSRSNAIESNRLQDGPIDAQALQARITGIVESIKRIRSRETADVKSFQTGLTVSLNEASEQAHPQIKAAQITLRRALNHLKATCDNVTDYNSGTLHSLENWFQSCYSSESWFKTTWRWLVKPYSERAHRAEPTGRACFIISLAVTQAALIFKVRAAGVKATSLSTSTAPKTASAAGGIHWAVVKIFSGIGSGFSFAAHGATRAANATFSALEQTKLGHALASKGRFGAVGMAMSGSYLLYASSQRNQLTDARAKANAFATTISQAMSSIKNEAPIQTIRAPFEDPDSQSSPRSWLPGLALENACLFGSVGNQLRSLQKAFRRFSSAITELEQAVANAVIARQSQAEEAIATLLRQKRTELNSLLTLNRSAQQDIGTPIGNVERLLFNGTNVEIEEALNQLSQVAGAHLKVESNDNLSLLRGCIEGIMQTVGGLRVSVNTDVRTLNEGLKFSGREHSDHAHPPIKAAQTKLREAWEALKTVTLSVSGDTGEMAVLNRWFEGTPESRFRMYSARGVGRTGFVISTVITVAAMALKFRAAGAKGLV